MAVSPHQIGRAHDRREKGNRRLARRTLLKRVALQTDFSRSLGDSTRNVTGAKRREENVQRSTPNIQRRSQKGLIRNARKQEPEADYRNIPFSWFPGFLIQL